MQEFLKVLQDMKDYTSALERGVKKFSVALPSLVKQHIHTLAKRKLNTTKDEYIDSVKTHMEGYVLVVELSRDSWIANAVEKGVDPFDMKEGLLNSPKAKISKRGFRYLRVPIKKDVNVKNLGTQKGNDLQKKIQNVLLKPKYDKFNYKHNEDGTVWQSQKVITDDPDLQGFYRTRMFDSSSDIGNKRPQWQHVMFRTVTDNPSASAQWKHPGIQPVHIFRETNLWLMQAADVLLKGFIDSEIKRIRK